MNTGYIFPFLKRKNS